MKKAIFLYNPKSGRRHAPLFVDAVCAIFRQHEYEIEITEIDFHKNPFDGNESIDLMVVAGGDGTINYVVNSMKQKRLDVMLAVVPSGTANDFARALGMPRDPLEAVRRIASGVERRIDCGCVNGLYFVNVLSFGLFTTTSQHTPDGLKHKIGKLAYLIAGLKELIAIHPVPLHVVADGYEFDSKALMVLIFNGESAGGIRLAHASSVRDGVFDCLMLERNSVFMNVLAVIRHLCGGHPKQIRHLRARKLDIISPINELTDVDGQRGANFPLHIECLEGNLRILCPR